MRTFKNQNMIPPGGRYFYEVPETKAYLEAFTSRMIQSTVRKHYAANDIPCPPNIKELIEDFICRRVPDGFCDGGGPEVKILTLADVRNNTSKIVNKTRTSITEGEADVRASICAACPNNDRSLCPTCVGLVSWALQLVGRHQKGVHAWLGVCSLDCSAIPAKIYANDVTAPEGEDVPEACWMKRFEGDPDGTNH